MLRRNSVFTMLSFIETRFRIDITLAFCVFWVLFSLKV